MISTVLRPVLLALCIRIREAQMRRSILQRLIYNSAFSRFRQRLIIIAKAQELEKILEWIVIRTGWFGVGFLLATLLS